MCSIYQKRLGSNTCCPALQPLFSPKGGSVLTGIPALHSLLAERVLNVLFGKQCGHIT